MAEEWSDWIVWVSAPVWTWLLVLYGVFEKGSSWARAGLLISFFGIAQMVVRACLTVWLGEDYPGRDWVLLVGRLEILVSGLILVFALHRMRGKTRQDLREATTADLSASDPRVGS